MGLPTAIVPAHTDTDSDTDLWVSWDAYHRSIEQLCLIVHQSGWQFDHILCLARGGLRVGDIFSRIYQLPLAILSTSSYREQDGTQQGKLDIAQAITSTGPALGGKVLLVDDLVDSGNTLEQVIVHVRERFTGVTEIRCAVLWYKACSSIVPDFYVEHLPTNPWIHQPFEDYDPLRPQHLAAHIAARCPIV